MGLNSLIEDIQLTRAFGSRWRDVVGAMQARYQDALADRERRRRREIEDSLDRAANREWLTEQRGDVREDRAQRLLDRQREIIERNLQVAGGDKVFYPGVQPEGLEGLDTEAYLKMATEAQRRAQGALKQKLLLKTEKEAESEAERLQRIEDAKAAAIFSRGLQTSGHREERLFDIQHPFPKEDPRDKPQALLPYINAARQLLSGRVSYLGAPPDKQEEMIYAEAQKLADKDRAWRAWNGPKGPAPVETEAQGVPDMVKYQGKLVPFASLPPDAKARVLAALGR